MELGLSDKGPTGPAWEDAADTVGVVCRSAPILLLWIVKGNVLRQNSLLNKIMLDSVESLYASCMDLSAIVTAIDEQIATLQQVKQLLSDASATEVRTEKAVAAIKVKTPAAAKQAGKRTMSAEGRARIAAAQKKRWAVKQSTPATKSASGSKKAS